MIVFWDIDGTLLTTGRAGIVAWEDAMREIAQREVDLDTFDTAGIPDYGIARRLLVELAGVPEPVDEVVARLVRAYEARLPESLHRRSGGVLPNVRGILERLAGMPDACSLLLTGNTERGARAKLAHYGLLQFFRGGGFSVRDADRDAIAVTAMERARSAGCPVSANRVYVVGDTPHDVRCGAAIGARTIAVATGRYPLADLAALAPWRALEELPEPSAFVSMLLEDEVPADV